MEREKGFESVVSRGVSGTYAPPENAPQSSTRPPDASVRVTTQTLAGYTGSNEGALPIVTPEMFLEAGLIVADRAMRAAPGPFEIEDALRRAVQQAKAVGDPVRALQ